MSANRKLLAEIQQVQKKVEEGIELFDEIWEKVYAAEQQSLKEKYESDLKKEIKKLQRLRDQIKTWIGGNDIKDKTQLIEARKNIETKMEQFKVCEKDTKIKAYSKEGLAREAKIDPKDALKEEKRSWVNDCIDKLNDLVNSVEVEKEKLMTGRGKNKNKDQLEKVENRIQKNKWHIARLELIIKLMDNGDLEPSSLDAIVDNLEYYIESAEDDDGALGVDDEFDIYEELELDNLGVGPASTFELMNRTGSTTKDESSSADSSKVENGDSSGVDASDASKSKKGAATTPATKGSVPLKLSSPAAAAAAISGKQSTTPGTAKASGTTTPSKAGKVQQQHPPTEEAQSSSSNDKKSSSGSNETESPADTPTESKQPSAQPSAPTPTNPAAAVANTASTPATTSSMSWATAAGTSAQPTVLDGDSSSSNAPAAPALASTTSGDVTQVSAAAASEAHIVAAESSASSAAAAIATVGGASFPIASASDSQQAAPAVGITASGTDSTAADATMSPALPSTAVPAQAPSTPQRLNPEMMATLSQLEQSMIHTPETLELDKQSRNFYAHTHPSYPTTAMFPSESDSALLFEKLPMDTLFFVFYFQQGTYQQYLAAKQLKKHSWRFHKKYMTWFQRHEEPKVATEEFEEGTYVYFDYESGWCQRIKAEFKFEYAYLEDELGGHET